MPSPYSRGTLAPQLSLSERLLFQPLTQTALPEHPLPFPGLKIAPEVQAGGGSCTVSRPRRALAAAAAASFIPRLRSFMPLLSEAMRC